MADPSQTVAQAHDLWDVFGRTREAAARAELIEHYMPFTRIVAARVFALRPDRSWSFDDYLQYARVGLIESIDRFDARRGVPFESYATHRIRGAILSGLSQQSEAAAQREFRRTRMTERTQSLVTATARPEQASLRNLIDITIGIALGLVLDQQAAEPVDESMCANPYAAAELEQFSKRVRSLVEELPEREREVIKGHYYNRLEFQEIATRYGITKGRVSQLHARALDRLRSRLDERPRLNRRI